MTTSTHCSGLDTAVWALKSIENREDVNLSFRHLASTDKDANCCLAMQYTPGGRDHLHGDVFNMLPPKERTEVQEICDKLPDDIYDQLRKVIIGCKLSPKIDCFQSNHHILGDATVFALSLISLRPHAPSTPAIRLKRELANRARMQRHF